MPRERGAYFGNALVYPMGIMGKRNEMPVGQAFFFSKCPALSQEEIPLDKVPSRYTTNFLLVHYGWHKARTHAQGDAHSKETKVVCHWLQSGLNSALRDRYVGHCCSPVLKLKESRRREWKVVITPTWN